MTTIVSSGQTQVVAAHMHSSGVILRGGTQVVSSAGSATSTVISSGGRQLVHSGAYVVGTTIQGGGIETLLSQGAVDRTTIFADGKMVVSGGAFAEDTHIESGGLQQLAKEGNALKTVIGRGGLQTVALDAMATQTRVDAGGIEQLGKLGQAVGTIVSSGGTLIISAGALAEESKILRGGTLDLVSGGEFSGDIAAGATVNLQAGETGEAPAVAKGVRYFVDSGAKVNGVTVDSGATLTVLRGGTAYNTQMQENARIVDSGGYVAGIAIANDTVTVTSGGECGMTLSSGSTATIQAGAIAGGGLEGGIEDVKLGAQFKTGINLDSGTLRVSGSNLVFETFQFGSAAKIDLTSFAFGPKETIKYVNNNPEHGTLTITDGARHATIKVITNFKQYVAAGFGIASDGMGGSIITYTPPNSSSHLVGIAGHN